LSAYGEMPRTPENPGASTATSDSPLPVAIAAQLTEIERRLRRGEGDQQPIRMALARLEQDLRDFRTASVSTSQNERLRPLETHLNDLLEALRAVPATGPDPSTQLRFDMTAPAIARESAATESNWVAPTPGASEAPRSSSATADPNLTAITQQLGTV